MPKTYNELYIDARKKLREAGVSAYSLEARLMIGCVAGKNGDELLRSMSLYASTAIEHRAREVIARRLAGEPVAYITGEWEFYGLPLVITRDVLIPRTDTEILAKMAIDALMGRRMDARVIDLCTGSGCVGCAIAKALPAARVLLADNSVKALTVARQNLMKNHLNPRASCIEIDARSAPPLMLGSFDLLVCNPPYIPTGELALLDASVKDYEPLAALDGGEDGLDFYRDILNLWRGAVRPGGVMLFEVGMGQAEAVMAYMRAAGLTNVGSRKDTLEIDRVVFGNV